jgi:hypothetical protein
MRALHRRPHTTGEVSLCLPATKPSELFPSYDIHDHQAHDTNYAFYSCKIAITPGTHLHHGCDARSCPPREFPGAAATILHVASRHEPSHEAAALRRQAAMRACSPPHAMTSRPEQRPRRLIAAFSAPFWTSNDTPPMTKTSFSRVSTCILIRKCRALSFQLFVGYLLSPF